MVDNKQGNNFINIYLDLSSSVISQWLEKKIKHHMDNVSIIPNTGNDNLANCHIIITDDNNFVKYNQWEKKLIIITHDTFFNEKHKLDCSLMYTPILINKLINIIKQRLEYNSNLIEVFDYYFQFNLNSGNLYNTDTNIVFTQNESILFKILAQKQGSGVDQSMLLNSIWEGAHSVEDTSTIQTHINTIKIKLKNHKINLNIKKIKNQYMLVKHEY